MVRRESLQEREMFSLSTLFFKQIITPLGLLNARSANLCFELFTLLDWRGTGSLGE